MITLEYNGTEQSLAEWGLAINSATLVMMNLSPHRFSAVRVGDTLSTAAVFPYRGKIIVRIDRTYNEGSEEWEGGEVDFIGYRIRNLTRSTGEFLGVTYTFENAWHFLNNTQYVQFFATRDTDGEVLAYKQVPELLLFTELDGSNILQPLTSGEQIEEILQFVLDAFAAQGFDQPFIIGDIDPQLELFSYQTRQLMCSATILKCLELSPDVNVVVDYTTDVASEPTPTIHFKKRSNWTPVSLALHNGTDHESLNIEPRYDLVPRSVLVWYKITGADSGAQWVLNIFDKYGPNGQSHASDPSFGLDVVMQFVDVQGRQTSSVSAPVETQVVDAAHATEATRLNWWKKKSQKLQSDKIAGLAIAAGSVTVKDDTGATVSLATYPNELTKGPLPAWTDKTTVWVNIRCKASYEVYTTSAAASGTVGGLSHHKHVDEEIIIRLQVTDAITTTYTEASTTIEGEAVPGLTGITDGIGSFTDGLAKSIYQSLSTLQWEGDDVRVEVEPTNQVTFANSLNLTGGLAAWTTMNAQVRAISKNYGTGETNVSFGPSSRNNADALFKIIQFTRPRFVWWNPNLRETASLGDSSGVVESGGTTPAENTDSGSGTKAAIAATATVTI
jgi:hypothetical protein